MVCYALRDKSITSWGPTTPQGHVWRARTEQRMVEFFADRDAPFDVLVRLADEALLTKEPVEVYVNGEWTKCQTDGP